MSCKRVKTKEVEPKTPRKQKKTRENQNNAQSLYHDVLKYVKHK